jgi:hypothetical protein
MDNILKNKFEFEKEEISIECKDLIKSNKINKYFLSIKY